MAKKSKVKLAWYWFPVQRNMNTLFVDLFVNCDGITNYPMYEIQYVFNIVIREVFCVIMSGYQNKR